MIDYPEPKAPPVSLLRNLQRLWTPDPTLAQRMLDEHRALAIWTAAAAGLTCTILWTWDWANDPVGAKHTVGLRLLFLLLLPSAWALSHLRTPRRFGLMAMLTMAWSTTVFGLCMSQLSGGMLIAQGGYTTVFFFGLAAFSALNLRWMVALVVLTWSLPPALGWAGLLPAFPFLPFWLFMGPMGLFTLLLYAMSGQNFLRCIDLEEILERASNTDPLTGASNRRHFMPALSRELERARRQNKGLAVLMLDIDHFKRINDTHGHPTGDIAIQRLAQVCRQGSRSIDLVARLGGEEFAVLLPDTALPQALVLGERLRQLAEHAELKNEQGEPVRFTVSVGAATLQPEPGSAPLDGQGLLAQADAALYEAKRTGRNRVVG